MTTEYPISFDTLATTLPVKENSDLGSQRHDCRSARAIKSRLTVSIGNQQVRLENLTCHRETMSSHSD
ncbi:MAG: hypothetical protein R3Y07_04905 [Eubacteriales bacterium]